MDPAANSSSDEDSSSESKHVDDPILQAISTINDGNGVDIDGIYEFVKARHDLMPDYRDVLEAELNERVSTNELDKVDNLYRINHAVSSQEPVAVPDPSSSSGDTRDADMILVAVSKLNNGNGADIDEIYEYIQDNYHIAPDYRDHLEDVLKEHVYYSELEMVDNLYRIVDVSSEPPDPPNTSSDIPPSSSEETTVVDTVLKAIKTLNDGNGADIDEISKYVVEEGYQLKPEHRKLLERSLDVRVSGNVLERVGNLYRIINVTSENTNETRESKSKSVADSNDQKKYPAASSSDYALPYGDMPEETVMEAISTMDYGFGVSIEEIYEYIENRYKIPTDYMKILEDELNRRVIEDELEKVENGYKIVNVTSENMDEAQSKANAEADPRDLAQNPSSSSYDPVIKAISTINDGKGVDIDGLFEFMQKTYRKQLEDGLKRRVSKCILEKVEETKYKIMVLTPEKLDEIGAAAAKAVAVSDQKEAEAKEAVEAAERAQKVLEENELILQAAKEALARFTKRD